MNNKSTLLPSSEDGAFLTKQQPPTLSVDYPEAPKLDCRPSAAEVAEHLKVVLDHSDWFFTHGIALTVTPKPNGFSVHIAE